MMAANPRAPWPCRDYNKNGCTRQNCSHTHICFKFVDPGSFCNAGKECKFNHNINDTQVKSCLAKSGFDLNVNPAQLRKVYSDSLKIRKGSLQQQKQNPNPSAPFPGQQRGIVDEIHRLTALLGVSNAPLVCNNFNHGRCTNPSCNLIHLCHLHVLRRCQHSFTNCPLSHDIFQPRVRELLMLAGFNVSQTPKGLMEDYRNALQVAPIAVQGRQHSGTFQQGHSGKLAKARKNVSVSKSYVDLRGESVKNKNRRGSSASRKTQSTSGSGLDSDSSSCNDSSDGESNDGPIVNTEKKTKNRRGRKKKQKPKAASVSLDKSSEPADKDKGAIPKLKGKSVVPSMVSKPCPLHVSLLDDATVCVTFLKGLCKDEKCSNHHQNMPYLWQYKILQDGWKWKTFSKDNVQLLEQSFCCVSTTSCPLMLEGQKFDVVFDNMAASTPEMNLPIRRLTSASDLDNTARPSFLTQWQWFWESDEGWIECGCKVTDDKCANSHIQIKLEKAYQGDPSSNINIKINEFKYSIEFSKMLQRNRESGTERRLRRRPKYFSPDDKIKVLSAEAKLGVEESLPSPVPQQHISLPTSWKPMPGDREAILVDVPNDSMDYRDITLRFQLTLPNSSIILLKRIQNPTLWMAMNLKKSKMEREHGEGKVAEMNLFHGTKPDAVNPICEQNFDWRLYGSATGTRYGKGVYFALQSEKADQYVSQDENGLCFMFSARVLLGRYTKGNKSMRRPPPVDPEQPNKLFDSCTDDPQHPSVFVLFDKDQFYPEFIICYKK